MIPVMCIVQEGQVPEEQERRLRVEICAFVQRSFQQLADIDWVVVPRGSGFTAAMTSTAIITTMRSNRLLEDDERTSLLKELSRICRIVTGRSKDEVVTAIRDEL